MSDYLENLASRALGKSDSLQPRIPSLFEPVMSEVLPISPFMTGLLEEPDATLGHESGIKGNKQSPRNNTDIENVRMPASGPIETVDLPGSELSDATLGRESGIKGNKRSPRNNTDIENVKMPASGPIETDDLPGSELSDAMMEQESGIQWNKQSSKNNTDVEKVRMPVSRPIETEILRGSEFKAQVQRDAINSIDLPPKPDEQVAQSLQREENQFTKEKPRKLEVAELSLKEDGQRSKASNGHSLSSILSSESIKNQKTGAISRDELRPPTLDQVDEEDVMRDLSKKVHLNAELNVAGSTLQPKIQPSNPYSKMVRDQTNGRIDRSALGQKALPVNRARMGKSVPETFSGREILESLMTKTEALDPKEIAVELKQTVTAGEREMTGLDLPHQAMIPSRALGMDHSKTVAIISTNPAFGLKRATTAAKSSRILKNSTEYPLKQSEQTPPSIKVTIGRIEVRAVTPAVKRETKKETKNPSTSLGDYLSSLRGGGR